MPDLSVIIPARKEYFLAKTCQSILGAIRGDTEIIAVIDGEHIGPDPQAIDDPRLRVIVHENPWGQRQSCNHAAKVSQAKYILKTDGHSMMDEGFDVKLMADMEPSWTVIPRMYNLHAFDLICGKCGARAYNHGPHRPCPTCTAQQWTMDEIWQPNWKKKTDWMWFRSPDCLDRPLRVQYWGQKDTACDQCHRPHDAKPDNGRCEFCGK